MSSFESLGQLIRNIADSPRRQEMLEKIVRQVLRRHLDRTGLDYYFDYRTPDGDFADVFLPEGFDDLPGSTIVEIKVQFRGEEAFAQIRRIAGSIRARSILLISLESPTKRFAKVIKALRESYNVTIWGLDQLEGLIREYGLTSKFAVSLAPAETIEAELASQDDWELTRGDYQKHLADLLKRGQLVLFTGAGVSADSNLPKWGELISRIMNGVISRDLSTLGLPVGTNRQSLVSKLMSLQDTSDLIKARYIESRLQGNFAQEVRDGLYKGFSPAPNGTLKAVARLCIKRPSLGGVHAVVSYNFDDLLEDRLDQLGARFKPIYRDNMSAQKDELGIYHVHGFLPRKGKSWEPPTTKDSPIVFSETGYHQLYLDPYSWSNLVQLHFLREFTCLLVGFSMNDPNQRRLLDIASTRRCVKQHYVILKRMEPTTPDPTLSACLQSHHRAVEDQYRNWGLKIIWVKDYSEIPQILQSLG